MSPPFYKKHYDMAENENTISLGAMEALASVMNDTPTQLQIGDETYPIRALRIGTQALIAEETCKIQRNEEGNLEDIIRQFAISIPSVVHCLTLAVLNDKDKIFKDSVRREYSDEYHEMYDRIMWESDRTQWLEILVEVVRKLNIDFFFRSIESLTLIREMMLTRKNQARK